MIVIDMHRVLWIFEAIWAGQWGWLNRYAVVVRMDRLGRMKSVGIFRR